MIVALISSTFCNFYYPTFDLSWSKAGDELWNLQIRLDSLTFFTLTDSLNLIHPQKSLIFPFVHSYTDGQVEDVLFLRHHCDFWGSRLGKAPGAQVYIHMMLCPNVARNEPHFR